MSDLSLLQIGAGGWEYFHVPGERSLHAYSRAFDFVEVNSTYYELRSQDVVREWRSNVPDSFEFSVRCPKSLLEQYTSENATDRVGKSILRSVVRTCTILRASVLAVLMKSSSQNAVDGLEGLLSDFHSNGTRVAVELRGSRASREFLDVIEKNDAIHCVDISKSERPLVESELLYTRLFGRGEGNIYEFEDNELHQILRTVQNPIFEKSILAFHGVRMYRDAARLKTFSHTGTFPSLSNSYGLDSLQSVLLEDAVFPITGRELLESQGWKLIDMTSERRARAAEFLEKLPPNIIFTNPESVIEMLEPGRNR